MNIALCFHPSKKYLNVLNTKTTFQCDQIKKLVQVFMPQMTNIDYMLLLFKKARAGVEGLGREMKRDCVCVCERDRESVCAR